MRKNSNGEANFFTQESLPRLMTFLSSRLTALLAVKLVLLFRQGPRKPTCYCVLGHILLFGSLGVAREEHLKAILPTAVFSPVIFNIRVGKVGAFGSSSTFHIQLFLLLCCFLKLALSQEQTQNEPWEEHCAFGCRSFASLATAQ